MKPEECRFSVLGLELAAQRWHAGAEHRVMALHGWLDNAESFAPMAPHLENVDLVALDLAGHGWSDHRAQHAHYLIWDDLREILAVADALRWEQFSVLGHSRGAMVACLLAAACPARISSLGLIDGFFAMTCSEMDMPAQLQRTLAVGAQPARTKVYASLDEMVAVRCRSALGIQANTVARMVERNAVHEYGWRWRTDPRLQRPSLVMLTPGQQTAVHAAITCPVRLVLAEGGMGQSAATLVQQLPASMLLDWSVEAGGHHLHMEAAAPVLGQVFSTFFNQPSGLAK